MEADQSITTACLATPPGRGGIAVILLQGGGAGEILARVFRPHGLPCAGADRLQLGHILDGGQVVDEAVVGVRGVQVEINIHGGPAAAAATLSALERQGAAVLQEPPAGAGLGPAHPRWANPAIGCEMLQHLPQAASAQVVAALTQQWSGGISRLARTCIDGLAAGGGANELDLAAARLCVARRLLQPPEVVLAGAPNAGKSTLANRLVGRAVSLVHATAGTTRDWVREAAILDGLPVWLTDTAGLWDAPAGPQQAIDQEAVRRAMDCIGRCDLVVLLHDDTAAGPAAADWPNVLHVRTKSDLGGAGGGLAVSAHTGEGLAQLKAHILARLGLGQFAPSLPMAFTERQVSLLSRGATALREGNRPACLAAMHQLLGDVNQEAAPLPT